MPLDQVAVELLKQGIVGIVILLLVGAVIALWKALIAEQKAHLASVKELSAETTKVAQSSATAIDTINQMMAKVPRR